MIGWNFYSQRRGTTLERFLKNVTTLEEAHDRFRKAKIQPPPDSELSQFLSGKNLTSFRENLQVLSKELVAESPPPPEQLPEIKTNDADIETDTTKEADLEEGMESNENAGYFRKTFSAKDSKTKK